MSNNRIVIFKEPNSIKAKRNKKKCVDRVWPEIVTWYGQHPDSKIRDLYHLFGERCGSSDLKNFKNSIMRRGFKKLQEAVQLAKKKVTVKESIQLTEEFIQTFQAGRKRKGIVHLGHMDAIVGNATEVLKHESEKIKTNKLGGSVLNLHLDNAKKLHSIGREVYGIGEGADGNLAKINIAILTNFDPSKHTNQQEVIDV
jgi:hypothetical protein